MNLGCFAQFKSGSLVNGLDKFQVLENFWFGLPTTWKGLFIFNTEMFKLF